VATFLSTNEMNSFTHRNIRRTAIDQILKSATTLAIYRAKDRIVYEDGGAIISQPVLMQLNQTAQTYSGADVLEASTQEEFSSYELPWKQATAACMITGIDKKRNQGTSQQLNLLKNKQQSALLSLVNLLAAQVYADGTGNGGKDWDGLTAGVNNANGFNVYLGIDRTQNPWWQAQVFDPGTPTALSTGNMMTLFLACTVDEEVPDLITVTNAIYAIYSSLLQSGERYVDDFVGGLGFSNLAFQGKPLVQDSHQPTATMNFHNLDHERLVVHEDENFNFEGFKEPVNQDIIIGRWKVYGNFEVRKPSACGVYRNVLNG
jgi:hypothetical protein